MSEPHSAERDPVPPEQLEPARHFAASYAGEHVAGTEFVIGALFVSLGVSTYDIIVGLLIGNLLAVLTWAWVCAPIAVRTRLTLYAYLEKIAGPGIIKLYGIVNGILFTVIAGAMITVSASAVRIPFDIAPQVEWYPTSISFVLVVLGVGAVISYVAVAGFRKVAQFAEVCAPWMILMFLAGALATLPILIQATPGVEGLHSFKDFITVGDQFVWVSQDNGINAWHIAAFAWGVNLPMHGALSDLSILRYARRAAYGYWSALGMYIGHYLAWVFAGIMGAGAALLMKTHITQLDAGEVAYQALGWSGVLAVMIAGWTTSNPTIYRAGLAFQSLNPKWSRVKVTAVVGAVTTIIACFPFVFSELLNLVSLMGLIISPIGAIIVTEHWLFPKFGLTRYWVQFSQRRLNMPAVLSWGGSLLAAWVMYLGGLHIFFLFVPTWFVATLAYLGLSTIMGARESFPAETQAEEDAYRARAEREKAFLEALEKTPIDQPERLETWGIRVAKLGTLGSLIACLALSMWVYTQEVSALPRFHNWLILPTLSYFVFASFWMSEKEKLEQRAITGGKNPAQANNQEHPHVSQVPPADQ